MPERGRQRCGAGPHSGARARGSRHLVGRLVGDGSCKRQASSEAAFPPWSACYRIARDLGSAEVRDPGDGSLVSDSDLAPLWEAARSAVEDRYDASTVDAQVGGSVCAIAAAGQLQCEAACRVDSGCDLGTVDSRCPTEGEAGTGRCSEALDPSACELDAACDTGCTALAALLAECSLPVVTVTAPGDAALAETLEENLSALVQVMEHVELSRPAAADLVPALEQVTVELRSAPACESELGLDARSQLNVVLEAEVTLDAMVSLSSVDV